MPNQPNESNPWKIISSQTIYQNRWIRIQEDKVVTPTGQDGMYAYLISNDSVMIVALNDDEQLYLVRTFRYTDQTWNWELPGGGSDQQHLLEASKRELEEETGIRAEQWHKLGKTHVCNGLMSEKMTTYLARNLSFGSLTGDVDEPIATGRFFSLDEIRTMIDHGDINDGQSLTALYLFERWQSRQRSIEKEDI